MAADTQSDIRRKVQEVRAQLDNCLTVLVESDLSPETAVALRQWMESAIARMEMVRDWLDERIR